MTRARTNADNALADITGVTASTGLTGTASSGTATLSIDSTVATLTGSQTLTNKDLSSGTNTFPASVVTTSGTQTLTNKTLTSPKINLTLNAQTGTSYTLDATDSGKLVTLSNAGAITLTVPPSVFSTGEQINIAQTGAGQVTLAQGSGVTINSNGATATAPAIRAQYSAATIICTASNTFLVIGDIA